MSKTAASRLPEIKERISAMRHQLTVLVLLLICGQVSAQPPTQQLEKRLAETTGRERLEFLVELTTLHHKTDPARAVAWGYGGARASRGGLR